MNRIDIDLEQWCASRETDIELGEAIFEIASSSEDAQRIWEEPNAADLIKLRSLLRAKGITGRLCWGESRFSI